MAGLIHVYTGNGKGKTTAALGLCFRALGRGYRIHFIQFMKGDADYGEIRKAAKEPEMIVRQFGGKGFIRKGEPGEEDIALAREGLEYTRTVMSELEPEVPFNRMLMVLDELNMAIDFDLLDEEEIVRVITEKPTELELVITGRNARERIIDLADYVTEMKEIKHPYREGIMARKGIEY
jgi:cob(I)alamin adenosyltransferase